MIELAALLAHGLLLGWGVPRLLVRARWVLRAPQLAIGIWQLLSLSFLLALVRAGIAMIFLGCAALDPGPPDIVERIAMQTLGVIVTGALLAWVGCTFTRGLVRIRRRQRWHATALSFTGHRRPELGATVLDEDTPAVYCLPGARCADRIIVTTGALRTLSRDQLDAAMAHEHGHLTRRHHLVLSSAAALARAFPCVPLFGHARREIAALAEMAADDDACRQHARRTLATALIALAATRAPGAALGAGGHGVAQRLDRLLAPPAPLPPLTRAAATASSLFVLAGPVALTCSTYAAVIADATRH